MTSRRLLKAAEAIRQVVGMAILAEMRDPRVRDVTITRVEVAPDMREAKVFVSVMGDTAKQNLCLHGLQSARGFLQAKLAEGIDTRYTPRLQFILDMGVKRSLEIARILQEVLPPNPPAVNPESAGATSRGGESGGEHSGSEHSGSEHSGSEHSGSEHSGSEHSGSEHSRNRQQEICVGEEEGDEESDDEFDDLDDLDLDDSEDESDDDSDDDSNDSRDSELRR